MFCKEVYLLIVPEDITPPAGVQQAMEMQAEAERRKRAQILESEGKMLSLFSFVFQNLKHLTFPMSVSKLEITNL